MTATVPESILVIVEMVPSRLVIVATPTCKYSRSRKVPIPVLISSSLIVAIPVTSRFSPLNCLKFSSPPTNRSSLTYRLSPKVPNPIKDVIPLTWRSLFTISTNSSPKVTPLI